LRSVYFTDANNGYAAGDSVTVIIKLSQPVSYAWTPSTGLDTINIANPLASPISTTTYYITDTTSTGCIAIDSVTVFVNPLTADAGTDKTIICGGTAQLNVTTNYTGSDTLTYIWSPSTGLNYDTIPNPTATVTDSITYTVTVTTPTGCIAIDTINIIVNPLTAYTGTNMTIVCGGTAQLNVTSNYTGTDTLTYIWSPATGLNYDTIPNPTATITTDSLTYTVTVTTPTGCVAIDSITVYVNPLIANAGSNKVIICGGSIQLDSVITNYTGTDTLTYVWSPSTGLNYDTIPNPTATITTDSLTFTVTVTTPTGCIAIDSITVYVNPLIVYAGTDKTIICGGSAQLDSVITNYTGSSALTYNWSPSTGLNYDTIPNPTAAVSDSTTYTVTVTTSNGCIATDHVTITLTPLPAEDICYVEFDSATSKNNISWASNLLANMDSVHIYNEISTGVWLQVGAASASQSNYIDTLSNPFNQSYSYKISVKDTCGNETSTSASHTTITLLATYDQGTNTYGFTWSEYKGLTIANYNIYGITPGGPDTLIGTVPGNQYFYNYTNPSLFFTKYYVGFTTPSCTSKTNHLVKSNYVQSPTGIAENAEINNLVSLYPNPVTDNLQIKTDLQIINIEITDITGRLLYTTTTSKTIDCSMFVKGVYFVTIKTEKGIVVKKVIKA
ncbi:MAG: T9SS type A sorting domain-containing protein, partial [Bacteroidetes bacterium]|nr:T9SS type A sorting domain-containing protein [Bacteroidota bacterium]